MNPINEDEVQLQNGIEFSHREKKAKMLVRKQIYLEVIMLSEGTNTQKSNGRYAFISKSQLLIFRPEYSVGVEAKFMKLGRGP